MPFKKGDTPWNKGNITPRDKEKGREHRRQYVKRNLEKIREDQRRYSKKNRKKESERSRKNYKDNPEYMKRYSLKRLYGLSYESWLEMWETQDGKCKICKKSFIKPSDAYVDHDHKTGEIRGLLCVKCNFGIGYFDNDTDIMKEAIRYLKKY